MGNKQASPQPVQRPQHDERLLKLYKELAEVVNGVITTIKKEAFQNYFRSKEYEIGELLFSYIVSTGGGCCSSTELTRDQFVHGFEVFIEKGRDNHSKLELYFTVFSDGESSMTFTDLVEMFHVSRSLAMALSGVIEEHNTDTETIADVWARSILSDSSTQMDCAKFCEWTKHNCPRVFDGIHSWILKMLFYRGHSPGTTPEGCPAVPCLSETNDASSLLNPETLWILSTILPSCFLYYAPPNTNMGQSQLTAVVGQRKLHSAEWSLLYNSVEHGQSLNRFKHHCMAYRGPTVTLLKLGKETLLVVAIDVEWRESPSSWGNSNCRIIQIRPRFEVLRAGPNLIFFNEKSRGLPSGIVFGQTSRPCVTLDRGLETAKLHYHMNFQSQTVVKVEVWGCGGKTVKDNQQKQQQWERKQAEKLQKVKRPGRWDDNPDKAILEMAGITTSHHKR